MQNVIKVKCYHYSSDWTDIREVEINIDDYVFFSIEYRCSSWHIVGYKCDEKYKWTTYELSDHGVVNSRELARFIAIANNQDSSKYQPCKVSRFNNLHYAGSFYTALEKLLELVYEEEKAIKKTVKKDVFF